MKTSIAILAALTLPILSAPCEETIKSDKPFELKMRASRKRNAMEAQIRIPKAAHKTALQQVILTRQGAYDIYVPVAFSENSENYIVHLVLPLPIANDAVLKVSHKSDPPKEGELMSTMTTLGPSYDIPLKPDVISE